MMNKNHFSVLIFIISLSWLITTSPPTFAQSLATAPKESPGIDAQELEKLSLFTETFAFNENAPFTDSDIKLIQSVCPGIFVAQSLPSLLLLNAGDAASLRTCKERITSNLQNSGSILFFPNYLLPVLSPLTSALNSPSMAKQNQNTFSPSGNSAYASNAPGGFQNVPLSQSPGQNYNDPLAAAMQNYVYDPLKIVKAGSPDQTGYAFNYFNNNTIGSSLTHLTYVGPGPIKGEGSLIGTELNRPVIDVLAGQFLPYANLMPKSTKWLSLVGSIPNGQLGLGVCPGCRLERYAFNVFDFSKLKLYELGFYLNDIFDLINKLQTTNAHVVELDFGVPINIPFVNSAIQQYMQTYLSNANVVAPIGLDPSTYPLFIDPNIPWMPAATIPEIISVGSTGKRITGTNTIDPTQIADHSIQQSPDVVAPGTGIWVPDSFDAFGNPIYKEEDGTTHSVAFISGILGLWWSYLLDNPSKFPYLAQSPRKYQKQYFEQLLYRTAADLGAPGFDNIFGYGQPDAARGLFLMEEDEKNSLAPNLTQGYHEWPQDNPGGLIFNLAQGRFKGVVPHTSADINAAYTFGGCGSLKLSTIKVDVKKPKLDFYLDKFSAQVVGVQGDVINVRLTYEPYVLVKFDFELYTVLNCILFQTPFEMTATIDYDRNAPAVVQDVYLRLGEKGYETLSYSTKHPLRKFDVQVNSRFPKWVNKEIEDEIREELDNYALSYILGSINLFFSQVDTPLKDMTEKIFNASLLVNRDPNPTVEFYNRLRNSKAPFVSSPNLRYFDLSTKFIHDANQSSQTTPVLHAPVLYYADGVNPPLVNPLKPSSPINYPPNPVDASIYYGTELANYELLAAYSQGAFSRQHNPLMNQQVFTVIPLGHPDKVQVRLDNDMPAPPSIQYFNNTDPKGYIGNVHASFQISLSYQYQKNNTTKSHATACTLDADIPVLATSLYKDPSTETDEKLAMSYFHEKLVPDGQAATMTAQGCSFDTDGVLDAIDLEIFARNTFMQGVLRVLHSLSFYKIGSDANLGKWGGMAWALDLANITSQAAVGQDIFKNILDEVQFDLDLGYTKFRDYYSNFQKNGDHVVRSGPSAIRTAVPPPAASLQYSVSQQFHPLDKKIIRHVVKADFTPLGANEEATVSPNRYYREGFNSYQNYQLTPQNMAKALVVEDHWQARLMQGSGPIPQQFIYTVYEGAALSQPFKLSGTSRNQDLTFSDLCDPEIAVNFFYDGKKPAINSYKVGPYAEDSIFSPQDFPRPVQKCDPTTNAPLDPYNQPPGQGTLE